MKLSNFDGPAPADAGAADVLAGRAAWSVEAGEWGGFLPLVPGGSIDLVLTDPPYNLGELYSDYADALPESVYRGRVSNWLSLCRHALKDDGFLCVVVNEYWSWYYRKVLQDDLGLHWRGTVVWGYAFGPHQRRKFAPCHAVVLCYARDRGRFVFDADAVRVPSARQRAGDRRADPRGRVPGDVWEIPRLCGTHKARHPGGPPNQLPLALCERLVLAHSRPGSVVLDPFAGSGTALEAAVKHGRRAVGFDVSAGYVRAARGRLAGLSNFDKGE